MDRILGQVTTLLAGRAVVVVGVGNPLRGDDGAGSVVAARLRAQGAGPVIDAETVPENHFGTVAALGPVRVLFVDALDHGGAPGSLALWRVEALRGRAGGTHAPSLALLGRLLAAEGIESWLLGIQPESTRLGAALGAAVEESCARVVAAIAAALGAPEECLV